MVIHYTKRRHGMVRCPICKKFAKLAQDPETLVAVYIHKQIGKYTATNWGGMRFDATETIACKEADDGKA